MIDVESASSGSASLNAESLDVAVKNLGNHFSEEMAPLVRLARFATNPPERILLPPVQGRPEWRPSLIPTLCADRIRTELTHGRPCAVRVQLSVKRKKDVDRPTHFDVHFLAEPDSDYAVTRFVRNDLAIPGQSLVRTHGYRSLVHIEEGPLCTLLGDAENPSHTHWNKDSQNFRGLYQYGEAHLRFVRQSAKKILESVFGSQDQPDLSVLSDFFGRPTTAPVSSTPTKAAPTRTDGPQGGPELPPRKPSPVYLRIEERSLGFRISNGPSSLPPDSFLRVRVAYNIPAGNPFAKFEPDDFSFLGEGLRFSERKGVEVKALDHNVIRLHVVNPTFEVTASGFDEYRDLIVHAEVLEAPDGSEAN